MREPATLMARPSALAATRAVWVFGACLLAVMLPPQIAQWCPWMLAPLVVSIMLATGALSALAWLLAAVTLSATLPPGGSFIPLDVLSCVLVVGVLSRLSPLAAATSWAVPVFGVVTQLVHDAAQIAAAAASSGRFAVDPVPLVVRLAGAGVLVALCVPPWVAWARRERERGRA